jgi:hypothetical protein
MFLGAAPTAMANQEFVTMLRLASEMKGYSIGATDGPIGAIHDLLFDDQTWRVRWLVADTGHVLPGRKVLLPPSSLGHVNHIGHQFSVRLTKDMVKNCPDIEADAPVSRRMEADTYDYLGWAPYWNTGFYFGGYAYGGAPALVHEHQEMDKGDAHLRSVHEVTGYDIAAHDGLIGHVADVLVEDGDWGIRYLVVDTRHFWERQRVLISPRSVESIDWVKRAVSLDVDREAVKNSPAYDGAETINRLYEAQFHDYYSNLPGEPAKLAPAG